LLNAFLQLALLFVSLGQSATIPLRTGVVARQLTNAEVAALEMVLPKGSTPWLLNGDHVPFLLNRQYVEAFLPPTLETPLLRRGMFVSVERRSPTSPWVVQRTEAYAQVAIPGRRFDDIRDDHDINRPFRVIGRFEDEELVSLVHFLRSNPPTRGGVAIQLWPILWNKRNADDSVDVPLMEGPSHGQALTLRRSGQDWEIVSTGGWAA
jgi:hypothetical protein